MNVLTRMALVSGIVLLSGCAVLEQPDPHVGGPVPFSALSGWEGDTFDGLPEAVALQCAKRPDVAAGSLCENTVDESPAEIKAYLEQHYLPHRVFGAKGATEGLITGYYEPLLHGSMTPDQDYRWPLYSRPSDLVTLDLAERYPELEGRRVRGRLDGRRVVPYWTRAEIDGTEKPLAGSELLWVDDAVDAFFLHVQGSGVVELADGERVAVGYSDQNGHAYRSIGRVLVEMEELELADVSLFSIRQWLVDHPGAARGLLNRNPSYVFFNLREAIDGTGPLGTLGVPLTPDRSIAVDPRVIPLGSLVFLDTTLADGRRYQRLMVAQDTGGAIAGGPRADIFFGQGERAEQLAGTQKSQGRLFVLKPVAD